jgi:hypothetical protein
VKAPGSSQVCEEGCAIDMRVSSGITPASLISTEMVLCFTPRILAELWNLECGGRVSMMTPSCVPYSKQQQTCLVLKQLHLDLGKIKRRPRSLRLSLGGRDIRSTIPAATQWAQYLHLLYQKGEGSSPLIRASHGKLQSQQPGAEVVHTELNPSHGCGHFSTEKPPPSTPDLSSHSPRARDRVHSVRSRGGRVEAARGDIFKCLVVLGVMGNPYPQTEAVPAQVSGRGAAMSQRRAPLGGSRSRQTLWNSHFLNISAGPAMRRQSWTRRGTPRQRIAWLGAGRLGRSWQWQRFVDEGGSRSVAQDQLAFYSAHVGERGHGQTSG